MNECGGRWSILTRSWSRASYNVTDTGILLQLWVSRLRADHQAFIYAWWLALSRETQSCERSRILAVVTLSLPLPIVNHWSVPEGALCRRVLSLPPCLSSCLFRVADSCAVFSFVWSDFRLITEVLITTIHTQYSFSVHTHHPLSHVFTTQPSGPHPPYNFPHIILLPTRKRTQYTSSQV